MSFPKFVPQFFSLTLIGSFFHKALGAYPLTHARSDSTNFTSGSAFESSLCKLMSYLSDQTPPTGFGNFAAGQIFKVAYGLALCSGDFVPTDCARCVIEASEEILRRCPYKPATAIWYDHCLLRYRNDDFFGKIDTKSVSRFASTANLGGNELALTENTRRLLGGLSQNACVSRNLYASGELAIDDSRKIHGLAQCTRDLSETECKKCLDQMVDSALGGCSGRRGVRIISASCYMRYELYPFLNISY